MIRNLKALGLALGAILALSAITASTALAQQGSLTSDGPVTLIAEQTGGGGPLTFTGTQTGAESANGLTAFGGKAHCAGTTYTGHKPSILPIFLIPSGSTQVTVTPHYGKCTLFGKPATIDMNGCDYVFDFEGTTGAEKFGVKTTIVCPSGKHIQVTMFENEAKHTEGNSFCMFTLTEKATAYAGLAATDTGNGRIDVTGTLKEITVHEKSEAALCAEATTTSAELHLDIEIEGRNAGGVQKAISISDEGKLTWPETAASSNATTMFGVKLECANFIATGHAYDQTPHKSISSGATTITLIPHYGTCTWPGGFPTTRDVNGCDYVLHIGKTSGEKQGTYEVTTNIVCPPGQETMFTMFLNATKHMENKPFCKLDVQAPLGLKGLHATETENGHFAITGTLKGIHVASTNIEGGTCPTSATTANAEFDFDLTVRGLNGAGQATTIALSD